MSEAYNTNRIRRVMQENGHATSEWHSLFTKAEEEMEDFVLVLCAYLDRHSSSRTWTPEEFRQAMGNFLGAAYGDRTWAARDQLADEIGHSHADIVAPYMNWEKYADEKLKGFLILHDGMYYHFSKLLGTL